MNRNISVALAVLLLVGGVASVATALPGQNTNAPSLQEESPEADGTPSADGDHPSRNHILDGLQERYDLTDAQVGELESLVVGMDEDGASRVEIRQAAVEKLGEFGVSEDQLRHDVRRPADERAGPPGHAGSPAHDGTHFEWYADHLELTDQQVEELRTVAETARDDGAYPAEVRAAVVEQLRSYGYTSEDLTEARWAHRLAHLQERFDLTDDQIAEIDAEVRQLVETDALDVEIRATVLETLQAFGVVPSEFPGARHGPRGPMASGGPTASGGLIHAGGPTASGGLIHAGGPMASAPTGSR